MESVHFFVDDKKISGILDDGNHDLLHFENKICIDLNNSYDDYTHVRRN